MRHFIPEMKALNLKDNIFISKQPQGEGEREKGVEYYLIFSIRYLLCISQHCFSLVSYLYWQDETVILYMNMIYRC